MFTLEDRADMLMGEVEAIVQRYVATWNGAPGNPPLWVVCASPGDSINIPGVTFGNVGEAKAGMEVPVHAHLIVINRVMVAESLLTTFFHEYGHAAYRLAHSTGFDPVDSEVEAICYSLSALESEGLTDLAFREADAVITMAEEEPYKSAVERLSAMPVWRKYARRSES